MNVQQMALQLQSTIQAATWGVSDDEVVFGSQKGIVAVYADAPTEEQFPPAFPCCLIVIGEGECDDDHPSLIDQSFRLVMGASSTGSPLGSHALIGGPAASLGKSRNRGAVELLSRVRDAVGQIDGSNGASLQVASRSFSAPFLVGALRHVAFAQLTVRAKCTEDLYYAAPQQMAEPVSGTFTWDGQHCLDRFDFYEFELMSKSGSNSTSTSDGTSLWTGTALTANPALTSGLYYTIFAKYDDRGAAANNDGESAAVIGTYVVAG